MQAKIGKRLACIFAFAVAVVLVIGGLQYAASIQPDSEPSGAVVERGSGEEANVQSAVQLVPVSQDGLERMRLGLQAGDLRGFSDVEKLGLEGAPFTHSSHYLAFVISHLIDEGVLPDREWELGEQVYDLRGKRLTTVLPKRGLDVEALRSRDFDELELRQEFHAGGPLDDPAAGAGLLDAIEVLRENFERVDGDGALVIAF